MKRKVGVSGPLSDNSPKLSPAKLRQAARQRQRSAKLIARLEQVFRQEGYSKGKAYDLAFHMVDWVKDFDALHMLYSRIDKRTDKQILDTVVDFLVHAPHHVNAAKFLYGLGAPEDVFDLGFFKPTRKRSK